MEVGKEAADAETFVMRFTAGECSRSTPHIYVSVLPFCSRRSSVYKNYWGRTRGLMDVKGTAASAVWETAAVGTWRTNSLVSCITYSPDGTCVVSGSLDGTIQVWDARTGDTIAGPFSGHTER